jgi:ribosomal protein L30E
MLPNVDQIGDLTRQITQMISTGLMLYGVSQSTTAMIVGIAGMLIPVGWGMIRHTKVGMIIAAANLPEVKAVKLEPTAPAAIETATPANVAK